MLKSVRRRFSLCLLFTLLMQGSSALAAVVTDEEKQFFEKVEKRKGSEDEVLLLVAIAEERAGYYTLWQKLKDLQTLMSKHQTPRIPEVAEAWVYGKLAYNEFLHGSKELASTYCNQALSVLKKMPEPTDMDGGYFYVQGGTCVANALYGLKRKEDFNRTETMLGHARIRFGRPVTEGMMIKALEYAAAGDYGSAQALCNDAIRSEPGYSGAYFLRGVTEFKDGKYEAAVKDVDKAISITPSFSRAVMVKAACMMHQGNMDGALAALNKALEAGRSSDVYAARAAVKFAMKDDSGGEADLLEACRAENPGWIGFAMQGDYMMQIKDLGEAVSNYTRALDLIDGRQSKGVARTYFRRALCYGALGESEKANADLKQAAAFDATRANQVQNLLPRVADAEFMNKTVSDLVESGGASSDHSAAGSSDRDYGEYLFAMDVPPPIYREGQYNAGKLKVAKTPAPKQEKAPTWGIGKSSESGSGQTDQVTLEAEPARHPYLKYLDDLLSSKLDITPSSDMTGTFQLEGDGRCTVEHANAILTHLLQRCAPFSRPPSYKGKMYRIMILGGTRNVRCSFVEVN